VAIAKAYFELADVAALILTVCNAFEIDKRQKPLSSNEALRRLLIGTSVKGHFAASSVKGFFAERFRGVDDSTVNPTS
jgi:hypothetical protein